MNTQLTQRQVGDPVLDEQRTHLASRPEATPEVSRPGPMGRLGVWAATHRRIVATAWILIVVGLGAFAPGVETNLAGAGWQDNGSESVTVRDLAQRHFGGNASHAIQVVVRSTGAPLEEGDGPSVVSRVVDRLERDRRIGEVIAPVPGVSVSADGRTAVVLAGAGADPNEMVKVATELKDDLNGLSTGSVRVNATGSSVLWSDFNEANLASMLKSEMLSWPVTMAILVLAFGALVAAGLPLTLTIAGLVASAGSLVLINELTPVSIWAMNFAMMFSLALGIDYALLLVVRFRSVRMGKERTALEAVAETMDTAGKAVLLSGATVMVALSAVMLVPAPSFRSPAGGIILSVLFVLAATLTLLPAVLVTLDHKINRLALPWLGQREHRSARFARWGEQLWARPAAWGVASLTVLLLLAAPIVGLRTAMPSVTVLPHDSSAKLGYHEIAEAFGPGAPGMLQVVTAPQEAGRTSQILAADPGIAAVLPAMPASDGSDYELVQAMPRVQPDDPAYGSILDRLRTDLPTTSLIGGAAAENADLEDLLDDSTPLVIGVVLTLGFLLLLLALRAPLISLLGTVASLLSTAAAFGVARLIFQDGHGSGLLGFESQGFLDAWAPVFFFAMIFAIAMDYTVFLLAAAKEHWEKSGDPKTAMVEALAHSGRVIFAAGGVMVAVFFTFALSESLPPKEMGVILGIAVLLDAFLVRLVLLPVILRLTGQAAWAIPGWLERLLPSISFSH
jgi:RND superfamily putative drug exporter